jgi:hypothetical protein
MATTTMLRQAQGRFTTDGVLLSNGTTAGWQLAFQVHPFSITGSGSFAGTITVYVDNGATAPTDADINHAVLGSMTSPGVVMSDGPYRWVKVTGPAGADADLAGANGVTAR